MAASPSSKRARSPIDHRAAVARRPHNRLAHCTAQLATEPAEATAQLETFAEGCDDLADRWEALGLFLGARGGWGSEQVKAVTHLLGCRDRVELQAAPGLEGWAADLMRVHLGLVTVGGSETDETKAARERLAGRPTIADLSPGHLRYPAAATAVASGVMPLLEGDRFQVARPVSGAEAVEVVARVRALADQRQAPNR